MTEDRKGKPFRTEKGIELDGRIVREYPETVREVVS